MKSNVCPVCASTMHSGLKPWHWLCLECKYEKASLQPAINEIDMHQKIDEHYREAGLRPLRNGNFQLLLKAIVKYGISAGHLLEVGCGHGWFLEIAKAKFSTLGIEPDAQIYREAKSHGLPVRLGFFPDAIREDELFEIIVFNDVFEHITDIQLTLASCRAHLKPNGILLLNLPSSSGIFYRISRFLCRFGVNKFFDRLWQKDLPTPHLHYFNYKNLNQLISSNGFEVIKFGTLPSIRIKGLYTRISCTGKYSLTTRLIILFTIILLSPLLRIMPQDIIYVMSKKVNSPPPEGGGW